MDKELKLANEIAEAELLIMKNTTELNRIEREEKDNKIKSQFKYMIVNGKLKPIKGGLQLRMENGLPVGIDDYGTGAVSWSLTKTKEEAKDRQLINNVIWAVRRLSWAAINAPNEVEGLKGVILTGGRSRGGYEEL